ncbi:hypothetical protein ABIB25_005874 [Nakamurella sp. UYEF19]|uniref:SUKH-4 family immunity protein n=1 Tax=Nakamurella sp. UYEF19 TaxID=1756392 RepID=UPI003397F1D2
MKVRPIPLTTWELSKAVAQLLQDQSDTRYVLTTHGMPSYTFTGFHPVPDLQIVTILDQAYVVIGHESLDLPIVLDPRDGRVLLAVGPAHSGAFTQLSLYNSSLRQYRACAEAFVARLPYYRAAQIQEDNFDAAAGQLRDDLLADIVRIDAAAQCVWSDLPWQIEMGDYPNEALNKYLIEDETLDGCGDQ